MTGRSDGKAAPLHLLHTAAVHIGTCDRLLAELAPGLEVRHTVRDDLLARAIADGSLTAPVRQATVDALLAEAAHAGAVLCTCSTLGAAAWAAAAVSPVPVLRIDEPMARRAVETGPRIGIAACVQTTIAPTRELVETVAARLDRPVELQTILVADAWPLFEAGDHDGYAARIADALQVAAELDVIVLAQASMAPAADRAGLAIPVLSSPRLGLEHAVAVWQAGAG